MKLNYKLYGERSRPCLVIIHGLFGSLDNWMSLAKKWSESFLVITLDLRNHGRSFHSKDMLFEDMTQDLLDILEYENISKINLVGHSLGGKVAMEFAANHPEYLLNLVVVDVAPYAYNPHHNDVFTMLESVVPSSFESRQRIEEAIRNYNLGEDVVQFMSKNIRRNENTHIFEWKFNLKILKKQYEYLITRIPSKGFHGPVLFIAGERSHYISKETSQLIFDLYPNFELEIVSKAGHWVHADNPDEFSNKIIHFITK